MSNEIKDVVMRPQEGFQKDFLSTKADIAIGGGAAGAGKTWALIMEAMRHPTRKKDFGGIIFRRTYPEIMRQGGLWDESKKVFPHVGAIPKESKTTWLFPTGSKIAFSHLQHEKDLSAFQGAQIPFIAFDELTHFSKSMFFYLLTRNRSVSGVKPYIRATCNPDPDSWVAELISWWIDQETGFPIPERSGVIRYFVRDKEIYIWGSTKQEVIDQAPHLFDLAVYGDIDKYDMVKSMTFIAGDIQGNKELMKTNPQYLSNLMSQDEETQMRLLHGNWKLRSDKLGLFDNFALKDMFTNDIQPSPSDEQYIVIDHARFGKDFCVIGSWKGWICRRIDILPSSSTNDIVKIINQIRMIYRGIPMSNVIIDQDGIGVTDNIGCRLFVPAGTPHEVNRVKQFYKNRKTQCYFKLSEVVNANEILCTSENIWFHDPDGGSPYQVTSLQIGGREQSIKQIIIDDLRTIKRENFDLEQKKQITGKVEQKSILGRSPDFGDMFSIRAEYEFIKTPKGLKRRL